MDLEEALDQIYYHSHFRNWAPDWQIFKSVFRAFPNSYSILTPFAYSYLEELIRSTTSEYGKEIFDKNGIPKRFRKVGVKLIELAVEENKEGNPELAKILLKMKSYFLSSDSSNTGNNRNSVSHGYMHPRFWDKESFERLIQDIAKLSIHAGF